MRGLCKRIGAFFLAGILLFSLMGCTGTDGEDKSGNEGTTNSGGELSVQNPGADMAEVLGSYVEEQLAGPKGLDKMTNLTMLSDGSLVILDMKNGIRYDLRAGEADWKSSEIPVLSELVAGGGNEIEILAHAVAKDGSMFYSFNNWGETFEAGSYPLHYYYVDAAGALTELTLNVGDKSEYLEKAVFTEDGALYGITVEGKVYRVDIQAQRAQYLFSPDELLDSIFGSCGNISVLLGNKKAYMFTADQTADSSDSVLNTWIEQEKDKGSSIAVTGDGERVYLASMSGIYSHVLNGSVMEQLADGALFSLGEPGQTICSLIAREDGSFLVGYGDGVICSYTYDPNASAVPKQQLNVYSLRDNATVRSAISVFRRKNQDVYVKLEIGMDGSNSVTADDAVKNLNTRILAGEAPDLMVLDGLPMKSYIEKGMLLDISDVIEAIGGERDYFTNLFEAYQNEGVMYAVPLRFAIPLLFGEEDALHGLTDLASLADRIEKVRASDEDADTILGSYTAEELLNELVSVNGTAWIDETGNVNREALQEFFTQAKRIYQTEQENLTEDDKKRHNRVLELDVTTVEQYWNRVWQNVLSAAGSIGSGITMGNISDSSTYPRALAILKEMENGVIKEFAGQTEHVYFPRGIAGITSGSEKPELAKEFLKEMLSLDVQKKDTGDGLPVNREAFESWSVQEKRTDATDSLVLSGGSGMLSVDFSFWPSEAQWKELHTIVENLKQPCLTDEMVLNSVKSVGESILTGEKSIEDGVNEIIQKINLYYKE